MPKSPRGSTTNNIAVVKDKAVIQNGIKGKRDASKNGIVISRHNGITALNSIIMKSKNEVLNVDGGGNQNVGGVFKDMRHTVKELHKQHRNKLEEITHRFESIKLTLSEKVESLKGECEDHLRRARRSEEALQKDADVKVQMALAPYLALPKEIESLKTVVEMRNEEIQKLRTRNTEIESQLEEIPIAREKIISLQQKVENLEAIINIKTDHEKQLHERCQVLMRKYDRESKANKRLSMDYEQVCWRMSQSEYGSTESLTKRQLSRSPPRSETTSPDVRRRVPISSPSNDVQLRVKSRNEGDKERNLRSRSATFVIDKNEDVDNFGSSPPSSSKNSNNSTPVRWRRKKNANSEKDYSRSDFNRRMCQSAGAEIISSELNGSSNGDSDLDKSVENNVFEIHSEETFENNGMSDSSYEMMMSGSNYARSLSGVSDSGMCDGPNSGNYDSMTGSEMLNSSVFSDSEWASVSANASLNCDSTQTQNDTFESEHSSYREICNSNTVVDISSLQNPTSDSAENDASLRSISESSSHYSSTSCSGNDTIVDRTILGGVGEELNSSEGNESFQGLPETIEE